MRSGVGARETITRSKRRRWFPMEIVSFMTTLAGVWRMDFRETRIKAGRPVGMLLQWSGEV